MKATIPSQSHQDSAPGFLPYGRQLIEEDDIEAVIAVLKGDFLTTGPSVTAFEDALTQETGAEFAISCANGTAALHLSALALGIKPGDCVIVPSITFLATANAVRLVGGDVVFADVDADSGLMTQGMLEEAFLRAGGPVKAVFNVHLNGQCDDITGLARCAERHGAVLLNDACHALGGAGRDGEAWRPIGDCAREALSVFSFHPVKAIAAGEGGAITTNDKALAEKLRLYRSHGMVRDRDVVKNEALALDKSGAVNPWYYEMQELGLNYRLSDVNAALAASQMKKLGRFIERRRFLADQYDALIDAANLPTRPVKRSAYSQSAWHLYPVLIEFDELSLDRSDLMARLRERGVGTQVHYIPVHRQPYYTELYGELDLQNADRYYKRELSLPLFPGMQDDDPARVIVALTESLT